MKKYTRGKCVEVFLYFYQSGQIILQYKDKYALTDVSFLVSIPHVFHELAQLCLLTSLLQSQSGWND